MIIKHYYRFSKRITDKFKGDTLDKENWDILRNDDNTPYFMIPNNKKEYDDYCFKEIKYEKHAGLIIDLLKKYGLSDDDSICSLGIGIGILEWHIKKSYPSIKLCCADYAEEGLKKVATMLEADQFVCFDIVLDDFNLLSKYDYLLMYRISTEFDINTWKEVFKRAYQAGCEKICFVPTEFVTIDDAVREKNAHAECVRKGEKDMFCGWLYSENEFINMFCEWYNIAELKRVDNTGIFLLDLKREISE